MLFIIDIKNIILLIVGIVNLVYGIIIYLRNRKSKTNFWFFAVVLAVTFWIFSIIVYRGLSNINITILWARILYLSATFIPFFFLYFTFIFPEEKIYFRGWQKYLLPIPFMIITIISLLPNVLIKNVNIIPGQEKEIIFNFRLHLLYGLYITSYFGWSYINLFRKYFISEKIVKIQVLYVIVGTLTSTMIGVSTNLIMPLLGIFTFNWLGQITVIIMITSIFYAILKHNLFNIKVIATELLTSAIWIAVLFELLLEETLRGKLFVGGLFIFTIVAGILLIKSVLKEVRQREEIQKLAENLKVVNEKLVETDKMKSAMYSFVSHQIKAPISIVKGFAQLILDGSYGKIPKKVKDTVSLMKDSSNRLIELTNNFLDLRRIDEGKMEYDFKEINLVNLVKNVFEELKLLASQKKLKFNLECAEKEIKVKADEMRLRQVILNLVENSVKYTEKGFVKVGLQLMTNDQQKSVLFSVSDSGIGIKPEVLPELFDQFKRAKEARNIQGTGLGLYLAKEIVKAHGGEIWAESGGEGRGSRFYVRLLLS